MEKFKVEVTTTFHYEDEVEAETPEKVKEIMEEAIFNGDVDAVTDTVDPDTVVTVIPNSNTSKKNGWQIAIDLTGVDANNVPDQNRAMISSPLFETEEEADGFYRSLEIDEKELAEINKGLDIILIHWVDGEVKDTWVY